MPRKPSGFTIVELLVVIAIIGILVALLMPAIQAARETARQAQCQNSLKQIGTGVAQHISTLGRYPTGGWGYGWTGDPDQGNGQEQPGGWIYNLLPYIDQQILHDFGAMPFPAGVSPPKPIVSPITESSWREGGNVARIMTALSAFICPTRRRAVLYPLWSSDPTNSSPSYTSGVSYPYMITSVAVPAPGGLYAPANFYYTSTGAATGLPTSKIPSQPLTGGVAKSDYAINAGDANAFSGLPAAPATLCEPTQGYSPPNAGLGPSAVNFSLSSGNYQALSQANTGVCFQQSMILPAHITDGANYTILAGEKSLNPQYYTDGSTDVGASTGDKGNMYSGASFDIMRMTNAAPIQDTFGYAGNCSFCGLNPNSNANYGSAHPNGVFFVMCDSSVRLIKYGINPQLFASLGNRFDNTQGYGPGQGYPPTLDDSLFK